MEILRGMSAGGFHETVYRILEETNDAESEEEDLTVLCSPLALKDPYAT